MSEYSIGNCYICGDRCKVENKCAKLCGYTKDQLTTFRIVEELEADNDKLTDGRG